MWRASARVDRAHLVELVHGGAVDLLLRVEAGAHHPLVGRGRAGCRSRGSAAPWRSAARRGRARGARPARAGGSWPPTPGPSPRRTPRAPAAFAATSGGSDVVGPPRVGEGHAAGREAGHHAVALVLAVRGVGELLQERVGRVVQGAGQRRVHGEVQGLEAVAVARRGSRASSSASSSGSASRRSRPSTARTASAVVSSAARRVVHEQRRCARRAARRAARPRRRRPRVTRQRATRRSRPRRAAPRPRARRRRGRAARTRVDHRARRRPRSRAGVSPVRIIRYSRCSTMPETVCTIEVKAATGIT